VRTYFPNQFFVTYGRSVFLRTDHAHRHDGKDLTSFESVRTSWSRRGDKGRDDRRFLEALNYFLVHNITWRALPEKFGHSKRLETILAIKPNRTFEAFFQTAMTKRALVPRCAPVSAALAKGGKTKRSALRVLDACPRL
jgi:hypothetical protein